MSKQNVPDIINSTIKSFISTEGSTWLNLLDPFAQAAMRAYVQALTDSGEYEALARLARNKYAELYGSW